jgi:cytokinin dehydrogenase
MKITTRRDLLKGLACGSLIVGFDPLSRSWVTGAEAASLAKLDHLPRLDGVLRTDDAALTAAAGDYGRFIQRRPVAVLEPGSVQDIARVIRFANKRDLRIAVRGDARRRAVARPAGTGARRTSSDRMPAR